ncbi:hypothetical protein AB0M68_36040 [Streptomyces sp. NPDC051453]|uniref:hypothetical protein n=1 Tax=Streptomyces sp. NPDC051453 TaxID=3154941 RepID=UPI003429EB29
MTPTPDDRAAAAWLCAALPELRDTAADDEYALERLDRAVVAVRDGRPAAQVGRLLGYEPAPDPDKSVGRPQDGHPESLDDFGLDAVTVRGTYRCPRGRCARRTGADEDGREPRCVIDEAPMIFTSL